MRQPPDVIAVNKAPHIRVLTRYSGSEFLFAVVETNAKDHRSYDGDILDRLVTAAGAGILTGGRLAEESFASSLANHLQTDETFRHNIGAVFYASVAMDADSQNIIIRTAGDLRVHALDAREGLLRQTRDHNAIDDDAEGIYTNTLIDQRDFLRHVPTRAIPTTERKPIERQEWPLDDKLQQLVICSSVVHRYRSPKDYLSGLLSDLEAAVPPFGFAAVVGGRNPLTRCEEGT